MNEKEERMETFIMLINLTEEGVKGIKDAPNRRAAVEKLVGDLGGEIKSSYLTLGRYDRVLVIDFPDGQSAAKFAISLGSRGFNRTDTLRAFNDDEALAIIADAP
jgi:uncharacterized protein with GYD domain